ncbi:MAG: hypothetical protein QOD69_1660 [Solirubrobacteraceae bacterium]|nr:hypothetical protein [Solirubrobacteraceae bacterium]
MPRSKNARTQTGTRAAVLVGAAALALTGFASPASAALAGVSPNTVPVGPDSVLLPQWYDDGAQRLSVCTAGDPDCGAVPDYVPPGGEAFYNRAVAKMTAPNGAKLTMVIAVEAAFDPTFTSTPITFTRIRSKIVLPGGASDGTFDVTEPFGTQTITTSGGVGTTTDQVGCAITTPGGVCDFSLALGGGVSQWLRWDPTVAPAAPAGYLGDGATDHAITGSPLGTNYFEMTGPGIGTMHTDVFTVTGKAFDATKPSFGGAPVAFGGLRLGTSAPQDATIRNDGAVPMTVSAVTVTGAAAADYQIVADDCVAAPLPANSSCTVGVSFAPSATGSRSAALSVASDAPGSPHAITLTGTGTQSVLAAGPSGVSYGSQFVGTTTAPRTIDLVNNGTAPLNVDTVALGGAQAGDYTLGVNSCGAAVAPGSSCHVDVFFTPGAAGVRNATVSIASDGGPATVSLSGLGVTPPGSGGTPTGGGGTPTSGGTPAGSAPPASASGATAGAAATPGTPSAGPATRPALALKQLALAPRVKQRKAQRLGLRLSMRVPGGTEVVKINVYRKTARGLKLLSSGFKAPPAAGLYRVSQSHPALRRLLTRGSYEVQATPGYSRSELGKTAKVSFKVV